MSRDERVEVAKIGKVVGLGGHLKLYPSTDFIEQFKSNATFFLSDGSKVTIQTYNKEKSIVKFFNFNVREDASKLTNNHLFVTLDHSRESCKLKDGEYFWFDVIGSKIFDNDRYLGKIIDIDRIVDVDYLVIKTDKSLVDKKLSKRFLVPYIDRYIVEFKEEKKELITRDTYELLEAS